MIPYTGTKATATYMTLYIGLVFLIAAAAVLALQQLSEASDNAERYGLLRKLGTEEKMINRALFHQIALYFLLPLSLAIVHSAVGIHVVNQAMMDVNNTDILGSLVGTACILVIVYGAYFLATYFASRSMIRQKDIARRVD
jgi:putative ABC transport system permease protein